MKCNKCKNSNLFFIKQQVINPKTKKYEDCPLSRLNDITSNPNKYISYKMRNVYKCDKCDSIINEDIIINNG